jgi:thioredoxin-related protein
MLTRRALICSAAAAPLAPRLARATAGAGDDGLHKQERFPDSFLELGGRLGAAAAEGRGLMLLFAQAGCPCCHELHRVTFARPEIAACIAAHFDVVRLDPGGAREVLDFDGEALEEGRLAAKWRVDFTPTTVLCAAGNAGAADLAGAETFRLPGYLKPFHYLSSLEYVAMGECRHQPFQRYLRDRFAALREQGGDPELW